MHINRLFQIIYMLLERKSITAKELAQKFEVSTRTIYRDVELLSAANIPIYATKGKGGGICLMDHYVLNKTVLSEEEQNQILFALQGMDQISVKQDKQMIEKISTLFQKHNTDWIQVDFSEWGIEESVFSLLKESILKQKRVEFTYFNTIGETKKRLVEPLQIYFKNKAWYLNAYCLEKEDYRLFKLSRMKDCILLEQSFERKIPKVIEERNIPTISLKLKIKKELSYRVYDEFKPETIEKDSNKDFLIHVEFPYNDWVIGYLLSFGEKLIVLSPEVIKIKIKEQLEKGLNHY